MSKRRASTKPRTKESDFGERGNVGYVDPRTQAHHTFTQGTIWHFRDYPPVWQRSRVQRSAAKRKRQKRR